MTIVAAVTTSRRGGRLDCGHVARPGELIHKLDTGERGHQTAQGNGPGAWVCAACATADRSV
jgi:hypothetical protein